ncbi:hypothetical protein G7062_04380 [Erysipelothrix sp. HDW6C]|uniref:hypothetical protein n=1 Tax=Erysipelothrix sp. HDW6C TaxID=2714930 RepID=UPI0014089D7C|nr:hypothetical protein [Erysipelothrix sp. HDW6C]QIK69579.1 hypothetical protein G7062_04380 [Erysipelothrix sp. HDW6C]
MKKYLLIFTCFLLIVGCQSKDSYSGITNAAELQAEANTIINGNVNGFRIDVNTTSLMMKIENSYAYDTNETHRRSQNGITYFYFKEGPYYQHHTLISMDDGKYSSSEWLTESPQDSDFHDIYNQEQRERDLANWSKMYDIIDFSKSVPERKVENDVLILEYRDLTIEGADAVIDKAILTFDKPNHKMTLKLEVDNGTMQEYLFDYDYKDILELPDLEVYPKGKFPNAE